MAKGSLLVLHLRNSRGSYGEVGLKLKKFDRARFGISKSFILKLKKKAELNDLLL